MMKNIIFKSYQSELSCGLADIGRLFQPAFLEDYLIMLEHAEADFLLVKAVADDGLSYIHREKMHNYETRENQLRRMYRFAVYRLLKEKTGYDFPWGILTGVRPSKIVQRLLDRGCSLAEAKDILMENYLLNEEKSNLLIDTVAVQQRLWPKKNSYSLYIGIPFCPDRCLYCSFSSLDLQKKQNYQYLEPYLQALEREIAILGDFLVGENLSLDSIYIGGGTPGILSPNQMEQLFACLEQYFPMKSDLEFTFEAGRPETMNDQKWAVLKNSPVNRVSINPQTMWAKTLAIVGRHHSPEQIIEQVQKAKANALLLNMDLIIGLPGEGLAEIDYTLAEIGKLRPDNLTLHALALKKRSFLAKDGLNNQENMGIEGNNKAYALPSGEITAQMISQAQKEAASWGMRPYYLYRQKNILGNLENTGFCFPGGESIYNINMIAENQHILGLGMGAGSKILASEGILKTYYNPKDMLLYLQSSKEGFKTKMRKINDYFHGFQG